MAYYRKVRKRDELRVMTSDGLIVVRVKCGRACIDVEAPKVVKLAHRKREKRLTLDNPKG